MAGGRVDLHLVEAMKRDGDSSMSEEEAEQQPVLLKGAIQADAFSCDVCHEPLSVPVYQCSEGHFFLCHSCFLDDQECKFRSCAGRSSIERSYGMDRAVRSILVDCRYADYGCQERTTYYQKESHEMACPREPCSCPYQGCGFAGRSAELLDHLTGHHKCPCTEFRYRTQFDLRVEPGVHVLLDKVGGQVLLVSARSLVQLRGYAVSIVYVPPCMAKGGIGCSVSSSCRNHHGTWTMERLPALSPSDWPPTDYICVVPKFSADGTEDARVVLKTNIVRADASGEEDSDDSS